MEASASNLTVGHLVTLAHGGGADDTDENEDENVAVCSLCEGA